MWLIVRIFFVMIAASIVLSLMLGWFALARARLHMSKMFNIGGARPQPSPQRPRDQGNVIEGEYRVITEEEKH